MEQQIKVFENLSELIDDLDREGITGIEKRRHIENFLMRKSRLHGRPYCASFELTPLCNFDCRMCYMHLSKDQLVHEGRILSTAEWLNIVNQAIDAGVTNVDITGGECLTHPGFKDIYIALANRGVHISVLTNGQLIDDSIIQLFLHYPPSVVQISLYGSNCEAYKKVTNTDAFSDVYSAITKLRSSGIRIKLTVTPNRYMEDDIEGLLDLLHSLNTDYTIGYTTLTARPETGRTIAEYIINVDAYIKLCKLETDYRKSLPITSSNSKANAYFFRIKGQETFKGMPCASGAANFHINWKGEMMPCTAFHTITKSVFDTNLEDAWTWIREKMQEYSEPFECKSCDLRYECLGCPAEKTFSVLNGSLNTHVCERMKASLSPMALSSNDILDCKQ